MLEGFGAKRVLVVYADPEEVAQPRETDDLASSVRQELVEFQAAASQREYASRWVALVK